MKIGLDLDEVTTEFLECLLVFYNMKTNKKLVKDNFFTYNFWEVWGGTREEAIEIVEEFHQSHHFDTIQPVKDSIASVSSLINNNEIFIITSRPAIWKDKTRAWIKKHLSTFNPNIIFSRDFHNQGNTKMEICKENGIELMIEDNGDYALKCAENSIKVILFDKPWNQDVSHKNIIRGDVLWALKCPASIVKPTLQSPK